MKMKYKIMIFVLIFTGSALIFHFYLLSLRPVEIIAVHHRSSNYVSVLVRSFPYTDRGKINWWRKNEKMLREKYSIPSPGKDGSFSVTFWLFGDGYKELDKYDRLCFEDMKTEKNCIEKDVVFSVDNSKNMGMMFRAYDGTYRLQKNGKIVKYVDNYKVRGVYPPD
ncbi:DUF943 family protein [Erwinia sorbitola]|uniref:DUF943 family protein n=1 Tax=Erwinia sorbitola TaxID=2681984 RepID=A0A6I6E7X4_9GAMM|nr:DUF943 family protein [Erwinia sorbitola]MTD28187.1 DUF943 family protein [Erwinia sorbitola]QGU85877.1 DUF943 family protein [Erwinia sorbitola]